MNHKPQIAQELFESCPGQAVVEVWSDIEDIGLELLDRQHLGYIKVTIRQLAEVGRWVRKAVFMHRHPLN